MKSVNTVIQYLNLSLYANFCALSYMIYSYKFITMDVLKVGDIYKSKDLAHQAVETFCENNHVTFRRRSSSSKQLIYKCKHGFSRKSMCSGKRPKQTVSYLACKAKICFYVNIEGEAHLKQFNNEHTHQLTRKFLITITKPTMMKISLWLCNWTKSTLRTL